MSKKKKHVAQINSRFLNYKFTKCLVQYDIALEFNVKINLFRHTLN